jgi:hypothetical protein
LVKRAPRRQLPPAAARQQIVGFRRQSLGHGLEHDG